MLKILWVFTYLKTIFTRILFMRKKRILASAVLLVVIFLVFTLLNSSESSALNSSVLVSENDRVLVEHIGKLTSLPQEEVPVVSIVASEDIARFQLTQTKVRDRMLYYPNAKRVITYDMVNDRIREVVSIE